MTLEYTPTGIKVDTLSDIIDRLSDGFRQIYGQDINLDQDTPDGQRIGIFAKEILDIQEFIAKKYHSMDPDIAQGHSLDVVSKIAGISRRAATQSTWDIEITASKAVALEAGYTIEDALGQQWQLDEAVSLTLGTTTNTFTAADFGAIEGFANDELKQVTIYPEITNLNAPLNAIVGVSGEEDEARRIRRNRSLENPALSTTGSLFAKLANPAITPSVIDLAVYENDTDVHDTQRDIEPHTLWAVIEGGTIEDITETITRNKTAGTGLKGAVYGRYLEQRTRPDGSDFQHIHEVYFDRPHYIDLHVKVKAKRRSPNSSIDLALVAKTIAEEAFHIGSDIQASQLYARGYQAGINFTLYDLEISQDNTVFTDERLLAGPQGKFVLEAKNVIVTEVI